MTGAKELKLIRLVILQRPARRTCYEPVDSPNPDTQGTYKVSTGSAGKAITVTVTGTLAGYTKTSLTSSATLKVGRVGSVAVSGKAVVGTKLTAVAAN